MLRRSVARERVLGGYFFDDQLHPFCGRIGSRGNKTFRMHLPRVTDRVKVTSLEVIRGYFYGLLFVF